MMHVHKNEEKANLFLCDLKSVCTVKRCLISMPTTSKIWNAIPTE